jgi:hypothetical protein
VGFVEQDGHFEVTADGYASLSVRALPDAACCKMKHLVGYEPLLPLRERRVGYTLKAQSSGAGGLTPWTDSGENSAFYGTF